MQRITAKQYRRSKYGNKKVTVDGFKFDSKAEATYYNELKLKQRAGEVLAFKLQPRYRLQEGFTKNGKRHRPIDYVADFEVVHTDESIEVIDVKGAPLTQVFRIKEKMFNKKYPYKLTLVKLKGRRFVEI